MRTRESALIRELLSLYLKYGPDTFEETGRLLREENPAEIIAKTLESLTLVTPRSKAAGLKRRNNIAGAKKSKYELFTEELDQLSKTSTESQKRAIEFVEEILDRRILKSPNALRQYMAYIGVSVTDRPIDRYDSIKQILEYLMSLPDRETRQKISAITQMRDEESSLQRWADIIVKPSN